MLVLDPVIVAVNKLPPWAFTLGAVVVAAALLARRGRSSKSKTREVHTLDTKIPIIGDMLESLKQANRRHDWFAETSLRFKNEPWQIRMPGSASIVMLSDPASIEAVMVTHPDVFVKAEAHLALLREILGDGIVNSAGERWYHQRKTAAKFFSARTLRLTMMQTMRRNIAQVHEALDAECGTGRFANLTELFHQFTLQTFLEIGVGIDAPIIGKREPSAFNAIDEATALIMRRRLIPNWLWKFQRWLNVGNEKKIKDAMSGVHGYVTRLIEQSLAKKNSAASAHEQDEKIQTAVELFVEHSSEDTTGLRPRDLLDFVMNFMVAARDTSAMTSMWLFYRLSKHPEIEAKIRDELATKLPPLGVGPDDFITDEHVKELVYLEAVIKETLRLHPAAPFVSRYVSQDTVIDGDFLIKKGNYVGLSSYSMARNPRVWGPDAAEFKPERWIDTKTGELLSFPPSKFFAFGAGPRMCLGMKLGMLNLRVLTSNLLHRYKFAIDPANDGSHINAVTLAMKHTLMARVERV